MTQKIPSKLPTVAGFSQICYFNFTIAPAIRRPTEKPEIGRLPSTTLNYFIDELTVKIIQVPAAQWPLYSASISVTNKRWSANCTS